MLLALPTRADSTPKTILQIGFAHLAPTNAGSRVQTEVVPNAGTFAAGIPERFDSPDATLRARSTGTLALTLGRVLSAPWAIELDVGIPPVIEGAGSGTVSIPTRLGPQFAIDLGDPALNPLGTARLWAPALLLQYHFRADCRRYCPYLGVGASYTWFTQEQTSTAFAERVNAHYGANLALLAGKSGPTTTQVRLRPSLQPALAAGLTYALSARWGLTASAGYTPVSTDAVLKIRASDGTVLSTTRNHMTADAVIGALLLSYRW